MLVHSAPAASLAALWFWPCRLYLRDPIGEKVTRCDCISPLLTASVNPMMPYLIVLALNHSFSVRRRLYSAICALRVSVVLCLPNVHLPSQVGRRQYEGAPCLNFQLNWKHSQCGRTNHSPEIAFFVLVLAEYLMTLAIAFKLWSVNRYAVQAAFVTNIWKSPPPPLSWFPVNFLPNASCPSLSCFWTPTWWRVGGVSPLPWQQGSQQRAVIVSFFYTLGY